MGKQSLIGEYVRALLIALLLALLIRTFVVQSFEIPSGSMEPTLLVGDRILVNKFIYGIRIPYTGMRFLRWERPKRGDVVVFIYPVNPSLDFIKRVIGTEGEKVQIIQNRIYINDEPIPDPWGYFRPVGSPGFLEAIENYGPVLVPKGALFVMGDNRDNSEDSRFWGFVPIQNLLGKAFMIYFSWDGRAQNPWSKVRWSRIGKLISGAPGSAAIPGIAETGSLNQLTVFE